MELPKSILVAAGGVAGAVVRHLVVDGAGGATWSLVAVNAVGAFLLGAVIHGVLRRGEDRRLLVGVGFCGALTTYSSVAVEVAGRLDEGRVAAAGGVGAAAVGAGLAAALLGAASRAWVTR